MIIPVNPNNRQEFDRLSRICASMREILDRKDSPGFAVKLQALVVLNRACKLRARLVEYGVKPSHGALEVIA